MNSRHELLSAAQKPPVSVERADADEKNTPRMARVRPAHLQAVANCGSSIVEHDEPGHKNDHDHGQDHDIWDSDFDNAVFGHKHSFLIPPLGWIVKVIYYVMFVLKAQVLILLPWQELYH